MQIPTSEEFFKAYSCVYNFEEGDPVRLIDKEDFQEAIIEFVKLHLEAQRKSIEENLEKGLETFGRSLTDDFQLEQTGYDLIVNSYPLDLIK